MTMEKDSRIVRVEVDWFRERECKRVGGGLSWPRKGQRGKSGTVQWVRILMYLIDKTFTFDNCTCTIVRHSIGAISWFYV